MRLKKNQEQKQLMVFGYGLPFICLFFAWRQYAKHGLNIWAEGLIVIGAVVLLMTLFARPWLKILFKYWMMGVMMIGVVVTTVILSAFFFLIITPVSLFLRMKGKDYMAMRRNTGAATYWIKREIKQEDYTQQF